MLSVDGTVSPLADAGDASIGVAPKRYKLRRKGKTLCYIRGPASKSMAIQEARTSLLARSAKEAWSDARIVREFSMMLALHNVVASAGRSTPPAQSVDGTVLLLADAVDASTGVALKRYMLRRKGKRLCRVQGPASKTKAIQEARASLLALSAKDCLLYTSPSPRDRG